jgi:hypothetical protein
LESFAVDDDGELYAIGFRNNATVVYKFIDAYFLPNGDYNQNGVVDAADYTVWRDTLGSTTDMRANGDDTAESKGVIDAADYAVWHANFGAAIQIGSASASAVPGPHGLMHVLMLALCLSLGDRQFWRFDVKRPV